MPAHTIPSYLSIRRQLTVAHPTEAAEFLDAIANLAWCAHEDYADGGYTNPIIDKCSPSLLAWDYLTKKLEFVST